MSRRYCATRGLSMADPATADRSALERIADAQERQAAALERLAEAAETPRRTPRSRAGVERARAEAIKAAVVTPLDRQAARRALSRVGRRLP